MYFGGDGGRLYCVDPATNAACAAASLPTGLGPRRERVRHRRATAPACTLGRLDGLTACIDVTAGRPVPGLGAAAGSSTGPEPRHPPQRGRRGRRRVLDRPGRRRSATPTPTPAAAIPITGWPGTEDYYSVTAEAETGKRTLMAAHGRGGLGCWDWTTMAPCTGGDYVDGVDRPRHAGRSRCRWPTARPMTGRAWSGLGDPGLIFTVDPAGHARLHQPRRRHRAAHHRPARPALRQHGRRQPRGRRWRSPTARRASSPP